MTVSTHNTLAGRWRMMSVMMKIITVNIGIFLLLRVLFIVAGLLSAPTIYTSVAACVELPGSVDAFLLRPWTALTYMFTQFDVMHFLFNMLWLYWFGSIFMQIMPARRLLPLYLYGGVAGAVCYLAASVACIGGGGVLIGSSAAVIAIVAATAVIVPGYGVRLLFLGEVKLKWIALVTIGIDLLGLNGVNVGGHIAHLGGALMGVVFALALKHGTDITAWPANLFAPHFKKPRQPGQSVPRPQPAAPSPDDIDAILDKIKRSGYTSLTPGERKILFSASSKRQP